MSRCCCGGWRTAASSPDWPGPSARYAAIEPAIGLSLLIAEQEQRARRADGQVEQARAVAQQLAERFRMRGARHPIELIDVVVGSQAVLQRFYQLERVARREIRGIDIPPYIATENIPERELLESGVASRWLYDRVALDRPGKLDEIASYQTSGEEARILADPPFKLVLADDQQAMILLTDDASGTTSALMVGPSTLLDGLSRMFEALWRFAVPLQPGDLAPGADGPTPAQSQLLAMLAAGMTDQTIARRLNVSMRTAHKRVQELMATLGADTRFQAGLQAKARHWL